MSVVKQISISTHIHLFPLFLTSKDKCLILAPFGYHTWHHLVIILLYLVAKLKERMELNLYHCLFSYKEMGLARTQLALGSYTQPCHFGSDNSLSATPHTLSVITDGSCAPSRTKFFSPKHSGCHYRLI